jgi:hypothetical protein
MHPTLKHLVIGGTAGLVIAVPTIWMAHALVQVLSGLCVLVAAVGTLYVAARRFGLASGALHTYDRGRWAEETTPPASPENEKAAARGE